LFPAFNSFNLFSLFSLFASLTLLAQNANDLTTSKDLQSLTRAQAAGGVHFRLKGTVLCYDQGWHQLYIHDGRSTVYFSPQASTNAFHPGQAIDVIGTALGGNSFTNVQISIVGEQPIPVPKPLALSQLASDHGQWIKTSGRVLSGETSRGR